MAPALTRRRFLTLSAAAATLPSAALADRPAYRWRGTALGAEAAITLTGLDAPQAEAVCRRIEAEIARLEDIFSLYRPHSALSRLNRDGRLDEPPAELVEVLALAGSVHAATGGAFDPTVQPLWSAHAAAAAEAREATPEEIAAARAVTGWRGVTTDDVITFEKPGMSMTLNGIAQGAIADRVAGLMRTEGLTDVLVDAGEITALGHRPDGGPWQAGVATPAGEVVARVALSDRALATTAPAGTLLDRAGRVGHILDPRTGAARARWSLVAVSASRAAVADALSTGFALMERDAIDAALAAFPGARIEALS